MLYCKSNGTTLMWIIRLHSPGTKAQARPKMIVVDWGVFLLGSWEDLFSNSSCKQNFWVKHVIRNCCPQSNSAKVIARAMRPQNYKQLGLNATGWNEFISKTEHWSLLLFYDFNIVPMTFSYFCLHKKYSFIPFVVTVPDFCSTLIKSCNISQLLTL